jgi:hypothetical protein
MRRSSAGYPNAALSPQCPGVVSASSSTVFLIRITDPAKPMAYGAVGLTGGGDTMADDGIYPEDDLSDTAELEELQLGDTDELKQLTQPADDISDTGIHEDDESRGFDPYNNVRVEH